MKKCMFNTVLAVSVLLAGCMPKESQENVVAGSLAIGTHGMPWMMPWISAFRPTIPKTHISSIIW